MARDELIDDHVSEKQCKLAVNALLDHVRKVEEKRAENQLLPGKEQNVWLAVTVKQMHPEKKLKPFKIPIVHPLVDPRTSSVCLITKDPQREYKDLLESQNIRFISRVVGITKLKGKFKPFEARRLLLKENDLFLADERVVPLLPGLLGKMFFGAKKQPIPVCLTRKDLKGELERAISSTYFHQNKGTCTSVKIGTLSQKPSQVLDNLKMALPAIVKNVKGEWDNIQSFYIKTNSSASLPLWSCNLGGEEGARWDGLTARPSSGEESEAEGSESESDAGKEQERLKTAMTPAAEAVTSKSKKKKDLDKMAVDEMETPKGKGKGRKRAAEEEVSTPQKKAKEDLEQDSAQKLAKRGKKAKAQPVTEAATVSGSPPTDENGTKHLPSAATDAPVKKMKKRKVDVGETAQSQSSDAAVPSPSTLSTGGGSSSTGTRSAKGPSVAVDEVATRKPKKKALISAMTGVDPSSATSAAHAVEPARIPDSNVTSDPEVLVTPLVATKKKARASAVDFFEGSPSASTPAAPPNTPADGLSARTPDGSMKKRKAKTAEATPLSNAIAKLAEEAVPGTPSPGQKESTASHGKIKKRKSTISDASAAASGSTSKAQAADSSIVTKEELKKRAGAGIDKKKEKIVKSSSAAKSAKHAIVGKKRL